MPESPRIRVVAETARRHDSGGRKRRRERMGGRKEGTREGSARVCGWPAVIRLIENASTAPAVGVNSGGDAELVMLG